MNIPTYKNNPIEKVKQTCLNNLAKHDSSNDTIETTTLDWVFYGTWAGFFISVRCYHPFNSTDIRWGYKVSTAGSTNQDGSYNIIEEALEKAYKVAKEEDDKLEEEFHKTEEKRKLK